MSKRIPVLVLTGAGASRAEPIKLPTMTEFFHQIMDENRYPKSPRITDKSYYKFIIDTLYGSKDNYDLERIMGALYGLSDFTNSDCWSIYQHPKIYDNIIQQILTRHQHVVQPPNNGHVHVSTLKDLIEKGIADTHEFYKQAARELLFQLEWIIREKYEHIPNDSIRTVYEPLFSMLIKNAIDAGEGYTPMVPFFTTNYDMSVDWFFEPEYDQDITRQEEWEEKFPKQIEFIDGFGKRGWNIKEYEKIDETSDKNIYVPYYKLHGSLYWEEVAGRVRKGTNVANDPHNPKNLMLVYPSDKKILTEDPYYYNQRQLELFLKRTDTVVVIGFSFRDPEIVRSFEMALRDNGNLNVIVVGPDFDPNYFVEMDSFLKNPRVKHVKDYFGTEEVINKLSDVIANLRLSAKEYLEKNSLLLP